MEGRRGPGLQAYDDHPFLSAVLAFTLMLALGLLIRTATGASDGLFGSNYGLVGLAAGLAIGMLLGAFMRRRYGS